MAIEELDSNNFSQVLAANKIVLVDFWAPWCGPCRNFALTYNEVAEKFLDLKFTKVNVDNNNQLAAEFNIRSIPHLIIFKDKVAIYSEPGALSTTQLVDLINKSI